MLIIMRIGVAVLLAACPFATAAVQKIHVVERADVLGGQSFGAAGPYEKITATAYFAVDPKAQANSRIADITKAKPNEQGLVEFSADLYVLKPRDPAKGNGTVLFEVSNRGGKGMLSMFNYARGSFDPADKAHFGDNLLLEQGFTLVWLGWQFDVADPPPALKLNAPVAMDGDGPITGIVRKEFLAEGASRRVPLMERNSRPYRVVDVNDPESKLLVKDSPKAQWRLIPRGDWQFEADASHIVLKPRFEDGRWYRLLYRAQDPALAGLGMAGIRDLIAFFKYDGSPMLLGDQKRFIKRAIGFGISQSGRFLRDYLYHGFNADEKGRKVFDGIWAHVAGASRGEFNYRFAQPTVNSVSFSAKQFPFTDGEQTDPEGGLRDGLLKRSDAAGVTPRIFYTNSSREYWGSAEALTHISADGRSDVPFGKDTRAYFIAGTQHGPGSIPPSGQSTLHEANTNDYRPVMRALLVAFQAWLRDGKEPPASKYPTLAAGQLVAQDAIRFPKLAGVFLPLVHDYPRLDFGPEFRTQGIISKEPPVAGKSFPSFVPAVNEDGNETSGIQMVDLRVPLATYTGWNLRGTSKGTAPQYGLNGAWFPFAATKASREKSNDSRPSLEERYAGRDEYLQKAQSAAKAMAAEGFLLDRDIAGVVQAMAAKWDYLGGRKAASE
jgi:hypothetical protein